MKRVTLLADKVASKLCCSGQGSKSKEESEAAVEALPVIKLQLSCSSQGRHYAGFTSSENIHMQVLGQPQEVLFQH